MCADIVVFDARTVSDRATFEDPPHQYAAGVKHVFVNRGHVLRDGEHGSQAGPGAVGTGQNTVG
jgi:N-acyl-D-amino-acid deacylase